MEEFAQQIFERNIPGVRPADQKRSRVLQDKFLIAGRQVLLDTRLVDISIPSLAASANSSVGGFYSRFESKEAFFEFLLVKMLSEHLRLFDMHLAPARFVDGSRRGVSEAFVDVMLIVFSGPWRGVLREAYSQIPARPESWEPMKQRGRLLRERITELYTPLVANRKGLEERVSFGVQQLFSALNNEMMNPHLAFSIDDHRFRDYLILTLDTLAAGDFTISEAPKAGR